MVDNIAVAHEGSPFISVYPWTSGVGFGAKYADPAATPTGTGLGIAFSPSGNDIAVAHGTTPFVTAYPWTSGVGFGTKYANPAILPSDYGNGVAFSSSIPVPTSKASIPLSSTLTKIWTNTFIKNTVFMPAITGISVCK